jgi:hypothetical protein
MGSGYRHKDAGSRGMNLPINEIRTDGGTQTRAQIDLFTVEDYRQAMEDGAKFPPLVVFHDGTDYWLADGFHRLEAGKRLGFLDIESEVRQGTRREAVLWSVGANASHGLRRSNADKRCAVVALLHDEEWVQWSDREIARRTSTSAPCVAGLRADPSVNVYRCDERKAERNGNTYTQKTGGRSVVSGFTPDIEPDPDDQPPPRDSTDTFLRRVIADVGEEVRRERQSGAAVAAAVVERDEEEEEPAPRPPRTQQGGPTSDQVQNIGGILGLLEELASPAVSAAEFKRVVREDPRFQPHLQAARGYCPAAREFLNEIERDEP